jgi:hypothetical protein
VPANVRYRVRPCCKKSGATIPGSPACRIGCRALGEEGLPPGGIFCLPLLIDRDLEISEVDDGFLPFLTGALRAMVGIPRLSSKLAEVLLRSGRVLMIVDGLSERNENTRRAFDPARPGFPIMRLIVTSRDSDRGKRGRLIPILKVRRKSTAPYRGSSGATGTMSENTEQVDACDERIAIRA